MARSTYAAPGVYVEEIPSARQPIAGVGTNTVGFIGIIPEDIVYIPFSNEEYDPVLARQLLAFQLATGEEAAAARQALQTELDRLGPALQQAQADLEQAQHARDTAQAAVTTA